MNKKVTRVQKENIYLKTEFISYLQSKDLAPSTIVHYVRELALFLEWIEKEEIQILKTDILNYLDYLKNKRKLENISLSRILLSLNHYFTFLHKAEQISANPCSFLKIRGTKKVSLYRTYTAEELTTLYDNYYNTFVRVYDDSHIPKNQRKQSSLSKQRNAVILNILIHQGATTKEIDLLELCDLDLMGASIKLKGSRKSNERVLPLQATQIGILMVYLQTIRPELLALNNNADSEKLFLPLPETSQRKTEGESIMQAFKALTKHIKEIDKNFLSFKQIRASVITNWLKVHGLRKTQVFAGHRYISSTERYKANDLAQLTEDINKLHPY